MLPFTYLAIQVVIVVVIVAMPFSHGSSNPDYSLCSSPYSCGRIKDAGFPFCGDKRPTYCGLHDFRLRCPNDSKYPWILVNTGHYNVHHIDRYKIKVSRAKNDTCNLVIKDQSSIDVVGPFESGHNVGRLTLFYGCPNDTISEYQPLSIECPTFGLNATVYYFNKTSHGRSCQTGVKLPVFKGVLDKLTRGSTTLKNALETEFELGYTADISACLKCQNSGGLCGSSFSNATEFACHKSDKRHGHIFLELGITGAAMLVLIAMFVACWYSKRLKSDHSRSVSGDLTEEELQMGSICFGVPLFSYKELKDATHNFDESSQLGHGGFGVVFYGKLKDGREVAVKRLYEKSHKIVEQFMNEVQILTCLRHQNLVSLYGSTSPQCKELLLVYEYVPNGTVADHLHGKKSNYDFLSWSIRLRIATETATALTSLHASDIIYRDIKTNNILLDRNFSVKVADFGLSRLFPTDVTHVSTAPQGTPGYLDPEYHQCYQLTVKSDVYSFGVVLVELISSLPAVDINRVRYDINLSNYAMKKIQQGLLHELVDPRLGFGSDFRVKRMITCVAELAFQCLQHDNEFRPSMDEVLGVLNRIENADYEAFDGKDEAKTPASPTEDDYAGLLISNRSSSPSNSSNG